MKRSSDLIELSELAAVCAQELAGAIAQAGSMVQKTLEQGGAIFFCGNGGSAADAQHLAAEYVIRFKRTRGPLKAMALTTDTSVLTAGANDFSFGDVFARQVEALAREGDLLFLHSTSGESENLLRAAAAARSARVHTVALLARDGGRGSGSTKDGSITGRHNCTGPSTRYHRVFPFYWVGGSRKTTRGAIFGQD